jgi:hypothetical protein
MPIAVPVAVAGTVTGSSMFNRGSGSIATFSGGVGCSRRRAWLLNVCLLRWLLLLLLRWLLLVLRLVGSLSSPTAAACAQGKGGNNQIRGGCRPAETDARWGEV